MRAKEYIAQNSDDISHLAEVSQVLADLSSLRLDKHATATRWWYEYGRDTLLLKMCKNTLRREYSQ